MSEMESGPYCTTCWGSNFACTDCATKDLRAKLEAVTVERDGLRAQTQCLRPDCDKPRLFCSAEHDHGSALADKLARLRSALGEMVAQLHRSEGRDVRCLCCDRVIDERGGGHEDGCEVVDASETLRALAEPPATKPDEPVAGGGE